MMDVLQVLLAFHLCVLDFMWKEEEEALMDSPLTIQTSFDWAVSYNV
jgi:hypothetical protein